MIEKILRKKSPTFHYGTVLSYSASDGRVVVKIKETTINIQTTMILTVGDTVTLARNDQDSSWLIIEESGKAMPSQASLLLV
jgi:hypothetical protein